MSRLIDKAAVKRIGHLARLELSEQELTSYSSQLAAILTYINKLNEIDTKDVPPTSHALSTLKNVFRKDVLKTSLDTEAVLGNAPSREDKFFRVPQVIEGK